MKVKETFVKDGYLMDPHTAACFKSYETCSEQEIKTVVCSTAEWSRFFPVIADDLTGEVDAQDIVALESISKEANLEIPAIVKGLFSKTMVRIRL